MSTATPQMRTLAHALEDCGGRTALANALGVAAEDLARWLSGEAVLPVSGYFRALDLVATGTPKERGKSTGATRYVRYRTAQAGAPAEDAAYG